VALFFALDRAGRPFVKHRRGAVEMTTEMTQDCAKRNDVKPPGGV